MTIHHKIHSHRLIITRNFESSRHQRVNLVTAFERVLPIVRRTVCRSPLPCLKPEHAPLQRRVGS